MLERVRFTIGGLMTAVGGAAVLSALVAWAVQPRSSPSPVVMFLWTTGPMVALLGLDAYVLVRRTWAGRSPWNARCDRRLFARDLAISLTCLYLPFFWVVTPRDWRPYDTSWAVMLPILPGFGAFLPHNWIFRSHTIFEFPLVVLTATLLVAGLTRLVLRGRLGLACILAVMVAIPTSLLAQTIYRF